MQILSIGYEGYNKELNQYANCLLLVQQRLCTAAYCYDRSLEFGYPICSELDVQYITEDFCSDTHEELLDSYNTAKKTGCAFICFVDPLQSKHNFFSSPRFAESDFELLIAEMGGEKIPEVNVKTPDFLFDNVIIELKDLQEEGLFDKARQKSIAKIFGSLETHTINLDPNFDYGELSNKYRNQIRNTIQNQIKKASKQIRSFKETNQIEAAGIILLNTGMFSLSDELFRLMVTHVLMHHTKTVEFALVFSQVLQSNGFDTVANFYCDFIGDVPEKVKPLKKKVWDLIESKMTELITYPDDNKRKPSQHPISFFEDNKIFYWNPGLLEDSRRDNN